LENIAMNTTPLHHLKLPGFKVVPRNDLRQSFSPTQSAYYVLLHCHRPTEAPHERVLFVHYLDHFLDHCQEQIDELWEKHRVLITHVAVRLGGRWRASRRNLAELYERAVTVQQLRQKLQPRFRRL